MPFVDGWRGLASLLLDEALARATCTHDVDAWSVGTDVDAIPTAVVGIAIETFARDGENLYTTRRSERDVVHSWAGEYT